MVTIDLLALDVLQAAELLRDRTITPIALTEAYLDRIERVDPSVNAYITATTDRALDDARRATDEIAAGRYRGPLHGIPIALKDLYATAGIRTTAGSKVLAGWVPEHDCTVARLLREAGSVLLGKLNTHEFAYGATTNNPHYGPTRNPWNLDHIPGGSSGGSGAAVAAGLALATMGSDTGGSIRMPAAFCGVVGLKPTYGRVSKAGVVPLSWSFDHAGPLTRTVRDAALLLQATAGYDPADASTVRIPAGDYVGALGDIEAGIKGMRIGVPRGYFFDLLDDDVRAAVEQALALLRELGATVRDVEVPGLGETVRPFFGAMHAEAQAYHAETFAAQREKFGEDVAAHLARPGLDAAGLIAAFRSCCALTEAACIVLEEVDVLVTPTAPTAAPRIGQTELIVGGLPRRVSETLAALTWPFDATHLPALSLPCGFTAAGLPIGLRIAGRPFDEATVLHAGHAYEQATDWHLRRPALAG